MVLKLLLGERIEKLFIITADSRLMCCDQKTSSGFQKKGYWKHRKYFSTLTHQKDLCMLYIDLDTLLQQRKKFQKRDD